MNANTRQYANVVDAAAAILEHTLKHDGGTFDPATGSPVDVEVGYVVALGQGTCIFPVTMDAGQAAELTAAYIQQQPISGPNLTRPNIGTWTHEGHVYVDAVEVIKDREQALELARQRGELAIWDVAAGAEIFV